MKKYILCALFSCIVISASQDNTTNSFNDPEGHFDPCYGRVMYGAYQMWHPDGCPAEKNNSDVPASSL